MRVLWKLASRPFWIVAVLCLCVGCAPSHFGVQVNPLTGTIGATVDVEGTLAANVTGTLPTKAIDPCGNARTVVRAVDPCGDSRAISPAYRAIDRAVPLYGRGLVPFADHARGLQDARAVAIQTKAIHSDLKRELHNAAVARDYTTERSMLSVFKGWWGVHRTLCPLDQNLAVQPTVYVEQPAATIVEPAAGPGPASPVQTGADGSFEIKGVTNALEKRVAQLEKRVDVIDGKLDQILAAIAVKR